MQVPAVLRFSLVQGNLPSARASGGRDEYLYFSTSRASKLSTAAGGGRERRARRRHYARGGPPRVQDAAHVARRCSRQSGCVGRFCCAHSGAQITCFTGTKSTNADAAAAAAQAAAAALHQFVRGAFAGDKSQVNPEFTCFTGTKVQILTLTLLPGSSCARPR